MVGGENPPLLTRPVNRAQLLRCAAGIGWAAWTVFLWFTLVVLPFTAPFDHLDFSWYALLAHDWREGLQAGVDFVFTYGPFGWLLSPAYGFEPDLLTTKVTAALAVSLAMAVVLTSLLRQI